MKPTKGHTMTHIMAVIYSALAYILPASASHDSTPPTTSYPIAYAHRVEGIPDAAVTLPSTGATHTIVPIKGTATTWQAVGYNRDNTPITVTISYTEFIDIQHHRCTRINTIPTPHLDCTHTKE